MKAFAKVILIFALSPLILGFSTGMWRTSAWCWIWIVLLGISVTAPLSLEIRGLVLALGSVLIAVGGKRFLIGVEAPDTIEALSQAFIMIGGGLGGNFMSTGILNVEAKYSNAETDGQKAANDVAAVSPANPVNTRRNKRRK